MTNPPEDGRNNQQQALEALRRAVNAKTREELIAEFQNERRNANDARNLIDNNLDEVEQTRRLPEQLTSSPERLQRLENVTRVVQQTIVAIQENKITLQNRNAQVIGGLLNLIGPTEVNSKNAAYLYNILQRGIDQQLTSTAELIEALSAVRSLKEIDPTVFSKLVDEFQSRAENFGMNETQREVFESYKKREIDQEIKPEFSQKKLAEIRAASRALMSDLNRLLTQVNVSAEYRQRVEAQLKAKFSYNLTNGIMDPEDITRKVEDELRPVRAKVQGQLTAGFDKIHQALTLNERIEATQKLKGLARTFVAEGTIEGGIIPELNQGLKELLEFYSDNDRFFAEYNQQMETADLDQAMANVNNMLREALQHAGGIQLNEKHIRLYAALSRPELFIKLLEGPAYKRANPPDANSLYDWNSLYDDINDIFEEILSVTDSRPNDLFNEAFNPMYEGNIYKTLRKNIENVGKFLKEDERYKNQWVEIEAPTEISEESGNPDLPHQDLIVRHRVKESLGEALSVHMSNETDRLYRTTEFLHNVGVICELGMGFEQLTQYSEKITAGDIDWLMTKKEYVSKAYQMYMRNLQFELNLNNDVLLTSFGRRGQVENMDSIESKTFHQLKSEYMGQGRVDSDAKIRRQVRMASGISKGFTGEFWGMLLLSHMPLGYRVVSEYDPTTGRDKKRFVVKAEFMSASQTGVEKMITQLDLDILLERFNLPNFLQIMRYAFAPESLTDPPDPYSEEGRWEHSRVYHYRDLDEDAMFVGYDDELGDFDEKFRFFREHLKAGGANLFARGGWRFKEMKAFHIFQDEKKTQLDFDNTMHNMKRMGSYAVKVFIDDLCDGAFGKVDASTLFRLTGVRSLAQYNRLSAAQKETVKRKLYEDYVFERMVDMQPTKFLALEARRYTPKGEDMLRDHLRVYLHGKLSYKEGFMNKFVLPTYIEALSLAEKIVWNQNKEEGNVDYIFGESDLNDSKVRAAVMNYYREKTGLVGKVDVGSSWKKFEESDEQFMTVLTGMFREFRRATGGTRHERSGAQGVTVQNAERRFTREWTTEKERKGVLKADSLASRYTRLLMKGRAGMEHLLGGDDFDFSMFYFQAAGNRMHSRMLGEMNALATKANPAQTKLIMEGVPGFALGQYKDLHAIEAAVAKHIIPHIKEIYDANNLQSKDQADEYVVRLEIFLSRILGKDTRYRVYALGSYLRYLDKSISGAEPALINDYFHDLLKRPVTSLDSSGLYVMCEAISNAVKIAYKKNQTKGWKTEKINFGLFSIPVKRRIEGEPNKSSHDMVEAAVGLAGNVHPFRQFPIIKWLPKIRDLPINVAFLERHLPMAAFVILMIMMALAKFAADKDKKK
ncbi:hypothetical protein HY214_02605 [Candidatus Roizmanbacteria bacterium]|nr:hypothetical protein [Candidatus Roizmanbacteria bacterium]